MTTYRVNGCKINLATMSVDDLFELAEMIGRNLDQAERELGLVNRELNKRALLKSFDPAPAS
jgi:hypothetical protein